jgi:hypothetical protein
MSRRGAQNPRYQKGKDIGKTRKSAASAKPKRSAGETGPAKSEPQKKSRFFQPLPVPDNPEFKRWRRIWLGLLVAAVVFSLGAWAGQNQGISELGTISLVAAYTCIFLAVYIDITKIRRMRKQYAAELEQGGAKKSKADSKDSAKSDEKKSKKSDKKPDKGEGSEKD